MPARDKTVLVVDDDETLRSLAAKLIERRGYGVLTAASGAEALTVLTGTVPVDLLVLDIVMPGVDGLQTLEAVRERRGYADLPVILLTAQSKDEDVMGGYKKGADYYLTKPLQPSALLNIVDYLIGDLTPEQRAKIESLL